MMTRMNLRHLAVFNGKEIVGIVSNFDLVRAAAKDTRALVPEERIAPMATA
jgi:signal-transduction protein with cAMP-binding, CBS, and nucleotidyltransferase domain